jgi:predicted MPP superfamily phosphohydrolase
MTITPQQVARVAPAPRRAVTRRGFLTGGIGTLGLAAGGSTAYAAAEAAFELTVTDYRPVPRSWPAGQRLTIAVVADVHAGGPNMGVGRLRQIVDTTNSLGCDLIVLLGDYVATHPFVTERVPEPVWSEELARLRAPLGVWAVLGNHDWWYDIAAVRAALAQAKIPLLENRSVKIGNGGRRFWLAGLGDQLAYSLGGGRFRGVDDLPGTLAQASPGEPVILLVHEPDIFPKVPERVALTLAGHTHGGQIRIPGVWPAFVPSKYGARYAYGHIVENDRHMIVSGGLGTSKVPLRVGVPPEIVRGQLG